MDNATMLERRAESVMEILAAQCADLEALLALARREGEAAERRDFEEIMRIVGERASLGDRLEVYHRQIAEMRQRLHGPEENAFCGEAATKRAVGLVVDIQTQDARTRQSLSEARAESTTALTRLNKGRRGVHGYLRDPRSASVAYDQII